MKREDVRTFIKQISGENAELVDRGEWVSTTCPLSPWTHEKGTDAKPSFGIHVTEDGDDSKYNCYTCKSKGVLKTLLEELEDYSGIDYGWLKEEVDGHELLGGKLPKWEHRKTKDKQRMTLPEPLDKVQFGDLYDPIEGQHPYLESRGITLETAQDLNLTIDPDNYGVERILFPVISRNGNLYGYTGRATTQTELKVRDYYGLPKQLLLLGEDIVDEDDNFIVLVEGLFDFAMVYQHGYSCVASLHSSLTEAQANTLVSFGKGVVVLFDNDKAGRDGRDKVKEMIGDQIPLMKCRWPKGVKDPGTLTKKQLDKMIRTYRLL